jgi:hypothetical protein
MAGNPRANAEPPYSTPPEGSGGPGGPAGDGFDDLAAAAASIEAGGPADAPRPAPVDLAALAAGEAREVVEVVASLALPLLPVVWPRHGRALAAAYGPEQLDRIAAALGQVAHKRGWRIAEACGRYGPEIALAAALLGPALPLLLDAAKAPDTAPAAPAAGTSSPPAAPAAPADDGRVLA